MQELITKDYNGFLIEFELIDGQLMANATSMCAAFGREPYEWLRLITVKRYIERLEELRDFKGVLVETRSRIGRGMTGTWIHERLILKLAQFLDVDFEIQCDKWVAELLRTGKVELKPLSPAELILAQAQQLVDHERRVNQLEVKQEDTTRQLGSLTEQVADVAAKQATIDEKHYSVLGYARLMGKALPGSEALARGRIASQLSRDQNYKTGKLHDGRFGEVNSYHLDILQQAFAVPLPATVPKPKRAGK